MGEPTERSFVESLNTVREWTTGIQESYATIATKLERLATMMEEHRNEVMNRRASISSAPDDAWSRLMLPSGCASTSDSFTEVGDTTRDEDTEDEGAVDWEEGVPDDWEEGPVAEDLDEVSHTVPRVPPTTEVVPSAECTSAEYNEDVMCQGPIQRCPMVHVQLANKNAAK